jgi:hypothetical protein
VIEPLITRLVQEAPAIDRSVVAELTQLLTADGRPLARSIAAVIELVADAKIDAGIALPALAMACGTLCDARLGEREREAARYEIETLLPVPGAPPKPIAAPDVSIDALRSATRRRT